MTEDLLAHCTIFISNTQELGASVNSAKARIDEINAALGNKRAEMPEQLPGTGGVSDAEKNNLVRVRGILKNKLQLVV